MHRTATLLRERYAVNWLTRRSVDATPWSRLDLTQAAGTPLLLQLTSSFPVLVVKGLYYFFRPSPDGHTFGQVFPADCSARVHEKLGWAGDVGLFWAAARVKHTVAADYRRVRIRQNRKGNSHGTAVALIGLYRINADDDGADASRVEIGETVLETP
ncbi:MAG TPA: hypothetical protein VGM62_02390 [Chthoniobacterales bacterium]|jgi:hypothetical protein